MSAIGTLWKLVKDVFSALNPSLSRVKETDFEESQCLQQSSGVLRSDWLTSVISQPLPSPEQILLRENSPQFLSDDICKVAGSVTVSEPDAPVEDTTCSQELKVIPRLQFPEFSNQYFQNSALPSSSPRKHRIINMLLEDEDDNSALEDNTAPKQQGGRDIMLDRIECNDCT